MRGIAGLMKTEKHTVKLFFGAAAPSDACSHVVYHDQNDVSWENVAKASHQTHDVWIIVRFWVTSDIRGSGHASWIATHILRRGVLCGGSDEQSQLVDK